MSQLSYKQFLQQNREYRFFISSFLVTVLGEWLTYIATIDFIEKQLEEAQVISRTHISVLVLVRLLPNVLLASWGGTLADSYDRRKLMILLDVAGALASLLFVLAYQLSSIPLIYFATFTQQCISGVYLPSHSSIIPLLVRTDEELKKATTLEGLTWSAMQAFGAAASGITVDLVGVQACFLIDGATFLVSAVLLWMVQGNFVVADESEQRPSSAWQHFKDMTVDGSCYLKDSFFGALVLLKATGALSYGACDILNVAFSEVGDPDKSNWNLGLLFSLVGFGCLLGPLLVEPYISMERPLTVQLSCVLSFGVSTIGYFGWSFSSSPFWLIGIFAMIRAGGSSIIWINSTLLLQKFTSENMLGRVMAADLALALSTEAVSAYICGFLMDHAGLSAYDVSKQLTWLSGALTIFWWWYHASGKGAGRFVPDRTKHGQVITESSLLLQENGRVIR